MPRSHSAGVLLYRRRAGGIEILLVHPGGPFWARKDAGAWSIPKGEIGEGEAPDAAARREFTEETGLPAPERLIALQPVPQSRSKTVHAYAVEGDADPASITSATVAMEWPPRSGRTLTFPEVDRAAWFDLDQARVRILRGQQPLLDELELLVAATRRGT